MTIPTPAEAAAIEIIANPPQIEAGAPFVCLDEQALAAIISKHVQVSDKNYQESIRILAFEVNVARQELTQLRQQLQEANKQCATNYDGMVEMRDQRDSLLVEAKQSAATIERLSQEKMVLVEALSHWQFYADHNRSQNQFEICVKHLAVLSEHQYTLSELELLQRKAKALDWLNENGTSCLAPHHLWYQNGIFSDDMLLAIESAMKGK